MLPRGVPLVVHRRPGRDPLDLESARPRSLEHVAVFVSPPPSDLKDDFLHTGDPCPNRRGLEELGLQGQPAAEILARLKADDASPSAILIGERIVELLGAESPDGILGLHDESRVSVLDTRALDAPAIRVCIGVPNAVERTGTWINVDGHRRSIAASKPAPAGVAPLTRILRELARTTRGTQPLGCSRGMRTSVSHSRPHYSRETPRLPGDPRWSLTKKRSV